MVLDARVVHSYYAPKTIVGKIVQFPLIRTLTAVLFVVPPLILVRLISDYLIGLAPEQYGPYLQDVIGLIRIALAIYLYRLFARYIEKRPAFEMSAAGSVSETGLGVLIGGGMMTFMVALLWILSYYRIESVGAVIPVIHTFVFLAFMALMEEIVFRAILFRHIEELAGTWGAIVITGLLFGLVHIGNPNATLFTSSVISLETLVLSGTFIFTRRIWLVWGVHVGWNYFQNSIFGIAVSGSTDLDSWLSVSISGPEWLTGGSFGVEGSYIATLLCVVVGLVFIAKARQRQQILRPLWAWKATRATADKRDSA